jgi:hypothetical protein
MILTITSVYSPQNIIYDYPDKFNVPMKAGTNHGIIFVGIYVHSRAVVLNLRQTAGR